MALHTVLNELFFLRDEHFTHSKESSIALEHSHFVSRVLGSNIEGKNNFPDSKSVQYIYINFIFQNNFNVEYTSK